MNFSQSSKVGAWLALLIALGVAGWFTGRNLRRSAWEKVDDESKQVRMPMARVGSDRDVFPKGSPQAAWMDRVKKAGPDDYAHLCEEWLATFEYDDRYVRGYPPHAVNALKWLMACWLEGDDEGFLAQAKGFNENTAADVMAELMPDQVCELVFRGDGNNTDTSFVDALARSLAQQHPELFLKEARNLSAPLVLHDEWDWKVAIQNLAEKNAPQAAEMILLLDLDGSPSLMHQMATSLARNWGKAEPPMSEWIENLDDAVLENSARHAHLIAVAESDPEMALEMLQHQRVHYSPFVEDSTRVILQNYAKAQPVKALQLLKEIEDHLTHRPDDSHDDPFDPRPPSPEMVAWEAQSPISHLPGEEARHEIIKSMTEQLPKDPERFMAALEKITQEAGAGDDAWRKRLEGECITNMAHAWSVEQCMLVAETWGSNPDQKRDLTLQALARQAARDDPYKALELIDQFPDVERWSLVSHVITHIPVSDEATITNLLTALPRDEWDWHIGDKLGGLPEAYADLVASKASEANAHVVGSFSREWAFADPEVAAQWVLSLPSENALGPAVEGLMTGWLEVDADSAVAWVESLPQGPVLEEVSQEMVVFHKRRNPGDAWDWANRISDPAVRAKFYGMIADEWTDAPDAFVQAHRQSRIDAGLSPDEKP